MVVSLDEFNLNYSRCRKRDNLHVRRLTFCIIIMICTYFVLNRVELQERDDIQASQAQILKLENCQRLTAAQKNELLQEVNAYEEDQRFARKIAEAKGEIELDNRFPACLAFLKTKVLTSGQSVLDLGSAAGALLRVIGEVLDTDGGRGRMVGVELVGGWVRAAKEIFGDKMEFYNSDITEFDEIDFKFDVITLLDVVEHVQPERYDCLFSTIERYSHPETAVYFHVPSPETQLLDADQFFENVVPHHVLVGGMADHGFQLEHFSFDTDTDCGSKGEIDGKSTRNKDAKCIMNGAPKYTHFLFRRVKSPNVLVVERSIKGASST